MKKNAIMITTGVKKNGNMPLLGPIVDWTIDHTE